MFDRPYAASRWTLKVEQDNDDAPMLGVVNPGQGLGRSDFDNFFDICAVEFDNDGGFVNPTQLATAKKAITEARQISGTKQNVTSTRPGVVVMVFVHGWKHNADWEDSNFVSFRHMVAAMSLRERERYDSKGNHEARRVVGIYLGWEGTREGGWLKQLGQMLQLDYWNRDASARSMAANSDLGATLRAITEVTKDPTQPGGDNSPLIFAGHSMGGLILEGAMVHWINSDDEGVPGFGDTISNQLVSLTQNGTNFAGPDVVLLINPASIAADSQTLVDGLRSGGWRKKLNLGDMLYEPPLVISVTSIDDTANKRWLPRAKFVGLDGFQETAAFTPGMCTHELKKLGQTRCPPAGLRDFGQRWHCLNIDPGSRDEVTPTMHIALPNSDVVRDSHTLYHLKPNKNTAANLMWIVLVPDEIIDDHSDIFNPAAASLFLALFQISGAVVSINIDWESLRLPT